MPLNGGDDGTTLTSDPMLPGRTKACASATGKKMASHTDDDVKLASMGNGRILRTTDVHVGRNEGLRGFTQ